MLSQSPSQNLDDYLPPAGPKLTYKDLLTGYGKWWQAQPSLTPYSRFYDIDSEPHYLIVWEGFTGFYDFYGDFADDNNFYNHVVKGYMIHFHISITSGMLHVRMFKALTDKPDYERYYKNPAEMRASMIAEWPQIAPTLGDSGERLKRFIEDNVDKVVILLKEHGQGWTDRGDAKRRSLVYRFESEVYLCLWTGAEDAIYRPSEGDRSRYPAINTSHTTFYAVFTVSFMRLPVRFELVLRQESVPFDTRPKYTDLTPHVLTSFEEIETILANAINNLSF